MEPLKLQLNVNAPCPCGSKKTLKHCSCFSPGRLFRSAPNTAPAGTPTGFAHQACFARSTKNCSSEISKEHYVSEGILERLNKTKGLTVAGLPWIPKGESRNIAPDALGSNVLCKRHNESYATLDQVAVELFDYLEFVSTGVAARDTRKSAKLVSGDAIKLWALKALCGFCASGQAVDHDGNRLRGWTPPPTWIEAIERRVLLPENVGVYFLGEKDEQFEVSTGTSIAPAFASSGDPVGLVFSVCGYRFALSLGRPSNISDTVLAKAQLHPGRIAWTYPHRRAPQHHLVISWTPPTGPSIVITA